MFRTAVKGLLAHKLRLALTAIAVVLGVSFMAGTFVLTDTIKNTFDILFAQTSAGKDVIVRAVTPFASGGHQDGFGANRPLIPDYLLSTVRSTPGVQVADGVVQGQVTIVGGLGKVLQKHGPPTLAFNWLADRQLSALSLRAGRAPASAPGTDEVTVDSGTARTQHIGVGDRVTIISNQPPRPFTVVGITGFGKADNLAGATILTFNNANSQQMFGKPGFFTEIDVHAVAGTATDRLLSAIGQQLPAGLEAVSGAAVGQQSAKAVASFITIFNRFLLAFALIALFVGGFLIFNTFSILVGQRTRELALLRAIGAGRAQVVMSVLVEALFVGLFGSLVGLAIGVPLAAGLYGALSTLGLSLPSTSLQLLPRTIIVSLATGTSITVAAAVLPALRASRIPPVAALRDDAVEAEVSLRRRAIVGGSISVLGAALLAAGLLLGAGLSAVGGGAAIVFVGVAMLAPFVTGPMARLLGSPFAAVQGVPGRLGQQNAARNPRRTAATASALMIGLALVAAIATLGASARASFEKAFARGISGDYVLVPTGGGDEGFSAVVENALRGDKAIVAWSPVRLVRWHDGNAGKSLTGIDPIDGPKVITLDMVRGTVGTLARGQVLIDENVARSRHLAVGDTLSMGFDATGTQHVVIGGIYKADALQFPLGSYTASSEFVAANVNQVRDQVIVVKTQSFSPAQLESLTRVVKAYPNVTVKTAVQFRKDQERQLSTILAIVYVLLALSIIIALIGVVNTLALSVIERTREIGLLRAVGMQRRQIKRMIRGEAIVVSLIGALLGLVLGMALGGALVSALSGAGFDTLAIPVGTIMAVLALAALFGMGAAVLPARRAAKLDVLAAIAAE